LPKTGKTAELPRSAGILRDGTRLALNGFPAKLLVRAMNLEPSQALKPSSDLPGKRAARFREAFEPVDPVYQTFDDTAFALTELENQMLAQIRRRGFESQQTVGRWADRVEFAI
jgi:hypothetical protein